MKPEDIIITPTATPNPQSLKFSLNRRVAEEKYETSNKKSEHRSPLAGKILGFPWAVKVFIGEDFITITKEDWVDWDTLTEPLSQLIKEHIENGSAVLTEEKQESADEGLEYLSKEDLSLAEKIKAILAKDIQPAVAMDGGFIAFAGYKEGRVFLKMQGACAGCPSSSITLKQGIESHLKTRLPEVKEVVEV